MANAPETRRQFARLTFEDGEVVVTPKDRDIFLISAERATEACRHAVLAAERIKRFESDFLVPLYEWCVAHQDKVRACFIPIPERNIQVFILTNLPQFDFDLAPEVAGLELTLARGGWRVGVTQLPDADEEALTTFVNPEGALEVYAQRGPAPQESGV